MPDPLEVSRSATRTAPLEPASAHEPDGDIDLYADYLSHNYEAETAVESCLVCHNLLVWHERTCEAATVPPAIAQPEHAPFAPPPAPSIFFCLRHRPPRPVRPQRPRRHHLARPAQKRHLATGPIQRINVYYLDNG